MFTDTHYSRRHNSMCTLLHTSYMINYTCENLCCLLRMLTANVTHQCPVDLCRLVELGQHWQHYKITQLGIQDGTIHASKTMVIRLSMVSSPHQESNSWPSVKTALTAGGTYRRCLGNCEILRGVGRVRPGTWNKPCWEWWVMVSWWFQEIGDPTTQRWLVMISCRDGSCSSKKCATAEVMLRTAGQMAVFHWPWLQLVDRKDIGWFHGKNGEKAWKSKINWGL